MQLPAADFGGILEASPGFVPDFVPFRCLCEDEKDEEDSECKEEEGGQLDDEGIEDSNVDVADVEDKEERRIEAE